MVRARLALCEPGAGRRAQPGSHCVNPAPNDVHNPSAVRLYHPFVGYDQAPAQVGDDDCPARVHGSGGDDGGGSGGGSDCAFSSAAATRASKMPTGLEPSACPTILRTSSKTTGMGQATSTRLTAPAPVRACSRHRELPATPGPGTRRHRDAAGRQPAAGVPPRRHRSEGAKGVGAS